MRACFRCPECEIQVRAHDDLLLVAGMRVSQRARLIDAGVTTVAELAEHSGPVPELRATDRGVADGTGTVADHPEGGRQARLRGDRRAAVDGAARREQGRPVLRLRGRPAVDGRRSGMGARIPVGRADCRPAGSPSLPTSSTRSGRTTGPASVRRWSTSSRWCASGCKRYPDMHIYHYAAYEKSTLLRLAGRYGVGENDVDDLLRNGILVDLYPLVRKSIRVGTENYSIKSLEPLYMGNELRSGEVTTATDSITQYARYCALRDEGRADEAAAVLKEIEDYNVYDCRSTRRLRDWMMARAIESGVPPRGPQPVRDDEVVELGDDLDRTLCKFAGDGVEQRTAEQTAVAMVAAARGFHRARGQAVLVGPLRPGQQSRRRMGRQQRRLHRREAPRSSPTGTSRRRRASRSGTCGCSARSPTASSARDMYALYDPPAPAGLADDPDRRAFGSVDGGRVRQPRGAHRGRRRREAAQGRRRLRPGAVRADAGTADQHQAAAGVDRSRPRPLVAAGLPEPALRRRDRHPAAPGSPHGQRRSAAPQRVDRRRHHRRAAGPRLVLPRGARAAGHRQDVHLGDGDRATGQRARAGASAWSRSRTRSSRTCSATSWRPVSTANTSPRRSTPSTAAGPSSPTPSSPATSPTTLRADRLRRRRDRRGTSPTPTRFRGWRSICSSSRRPASTASPTRSRSHRRPAT